MRKFEPWPSIALAAGLFGVGLTVAPGALGALLSAYAVVILVGVANGR